VVAPSGGERGRHGKAGSLGRDQRQGHPGAGRFDGFGDAKIILETIEFLERGNVPAARDGVLAVGGGDAHLTLRIACFTHLIVLITRAFKPVNHKDDLHLRAAIEYVRHVGPHVVGRIDERASYLEEAIELFDKLAADPAMGLLDHMRDKQVAHWATYAPSEEPQIRHAFEIGRVASVIWELLAWGVGVLGVSLESQTQEHRKSADGFWGKFES